MARYLVHYRSPFLIVSWNMDTFAHGMKYINDQIEHDREAVASRRDPVPPRQVPVDVVASIEEVPQ